MSDEAEEKTCRTCGHSWIGSDLRAESCPLCRSGRRITEKRIREEQKAEYWLIKQGSRPLGQSSMDHFNAEKEVTPGVDPNIRYYKGKYAVRVLKRSRLNWLVDPIDEIPDQNTAFTCPIRLLHRKRKEVKPKNVIS